MLSLSTLRRLASVTIFVLLTGCAAETLHREGIQAMGQQQYTEAVTRLQKAAELKPDNSVYRKDWLRARESATAKLLAQANDAMASGKFADAERHYNTILEIERGNARATAGLEAITRAYQADDDAAKAQAALKRGDTAQATELASRALANNANHVAGRAVRRELDALQAKDMLLAPTLGAVYKKPLNLEFRDASIKMVFDALSRTTGINFIFDRDVRSDQRTTVFLKQTNLEDAIDLILSTGQLEKKVLNASSVLIYPSTPAKIKEYQDLMVRVFYLSNVEAKNAATMLKTVLKIKDIFVDDKYNLLMLRESIETITLAERLIALHDMEEGEVMLEVEVLEINRSRLLNLGIQVTDQLTITPLSALSGPGQAGTMRLTDLKGLTASKFGVTIPSATINLQKIDGDANLLANPRIRVRDREKAKILIGDKVPVVTTTSSGTFVSENIQYVDVGLKLEVEPTIYLRDEIGLKLSLEVSSLVSSLKTNNGSQAFQIGTRNFSTGLRLKDGETQIMAGLISDEDRSAANRIPLLGDLPVLGRLFSSQNDNRKKTEIVLSITPRLIRNIRRQDPSAEAFWTGTETSLKTRPLQLREFEPAPAGDAPAPSTGKLPNVVPPAVSAPDAPTMRWQGSATAKVGQALSLTLEMDSAELVRATPLQLGFNPAEVQVLSVQEGEYYSRGAKSSFSHTIDNTGGRVSVGVSSEDGSGAKGAAKLLTIVVKPLVALSTGVDISVIAATPVGVERAISRPTLPVTHRIITTP